jgi:hypothetical protein
VADARSCARASAAVAGRLQTNLFYLEERTIGIFPLACQLEHACRPNANVTTDPTAHSLCVTTTKPVRAGERVTFCYIGENIPDGMELADMWPFTKRRKHLLEQVGFECHCATCAADAATLGVCEKL